MHNNKTQSYKNADHYSQRAQQQGYLARSVYKLEEITQKFHILATSRRVLDLGAAPGSWTQYCLRNIAKLQLYLAVDILPLASVLKNPKTQPILSNVQDDFTDAKVKQAILEQGPFDCILSDAAPNTSGVKNLDAARSFELVKSVVEYIYSSLSQNGSAIIKIFESQEERQLIKELRLLFREVKTVKPRACRSISKEHYLVCIKKLADLGEQTI